MTDLEQLLALLDSFGLEEGDNWEAGNPGYTLEEVSGSIRVRMGVNRYNANGCGGASQFLFTPEGAFIDHSGYPD